MACVRIAFVAPDDWTVWLFYRQLIRALSVAGARITVFSAAGQYVPRLLALDTEHVAVPYARFVDPYRDLRLFWSLWRGFLTRRFDVVHNFTIKANLYGALAASAAGVRSIINTVDGAGLLYSGTLDWRLRLVRGVAEIGLRRVRARVLRYWFVNPHDRDVFVARGLALPESCVVAIATGVDTQQFDPETVPRSAIAAFREEIGVSDHVPLVTMVAGRLLRSKGVGEFVEMARRLRAQGVRMQALLIGPEERDHPDALPSSAWSGAVREGVVRLMGFREDVWTAYAASDVVVVPTYYAEGTPKGVMEGMAMARAVVASDLPSTRQLVTHGRDGILVRPRDPGDLTTAVAALLASPARRSALGQEARRTAVTRLDAEQAARSAVDRVYGAVPGWPHAGRDAA